MTFLCHSSSPPSPILSLFGGFYDPGLATVRPRWFNDFYVFDVVREVWAYSHRPSPLAVGRVPTERSSTIFVVGSGRQEAYVLGGFSRLVSGSKRALAVTNDASSSAANQLPEARIHTDTWKTTNLPELLDRVLYGKGEETEIRWERVSMRGRKKCGVSSAVVRNDKEGDEVGNGKAITVLAFGGVDDVMENGHEVRSTFYDDLEIVDVTKGRWSVASVGESGNVQAEEDLGDRGWSMNKLKIALGQVTGGSIETEINKNNVATCTLNSENKMQVLPEGESSDEDEEEKQEEKGEEEEENEVTSCGSPLAEGESSGEEEEEKKEETDESVSDAEVEEKEIENDRDDEKYKPKKPSLSASFPTSVPTSLSDAPLPRYHAHILLCARTLYLYGGVLEVGDREVTLDDLWAVDCTSSSPLWMEWGQWRCLYPGTAHVQEWNGSDDDGDTTSSYASAIADDGDGKDGSEEENDNGIAEAGGNKYSMLRKMERGALQEERRALEDQLLPSPGGVSGDPGLIPRPGETLSDFYSRTSRHWIMRVATAPSSNVNMYQENKESEKVDGISSSQKEIKRLAFVLAKERYEPFMPVLERLSEIEGEEKRIEEDREERRERKKKEKKKSKDKKKMMEKEMEEGADDRIAFFLHKIRCELNDSYPLINFKLKTL
eukprot:CAMPEP_0113307130 /NCGR_PEP_ID=MMETSP0010_2-20120614/6104_1 /TAXON_ID=216773 ORGANISM="Corethron hystrix, Strain 308" /NCGR_SAMPLE_ID=MMETSP0010_2 /ASSEMBLY_ACC=CAM_ASM_000155 /LENGTH=661 /DNA_ID=CAMNT_0000161935 /DNA_START=198 /DNA_END=2180 /DNA_ORIENTATION=- /assembly_acc=CAM_ASM_000155